jgi:hypothetical protein
VFSAGVQAPVSPNRAHMVNRSVTIAPATAGIDGNRRNCHCSAIRWSRKFRNLDIRPDPEISVIWSFRPVCKPPSVPTGPTWSIDQSRWPQQPLESTATGGKVLAVRFGGLENFATWNSGPTLKFQSFGVFGRCASPRRSQPGPHGRLISHDGHSNRWNRRRQAKLSL